eukprot:TRINITY_DN61730_c0_g1_i1.p1 TRINITY_DN61730_c0_g1~~TRINITY_DN61730_c0_g1_i1.p1  ORF type:complete len:256 (-),score=31.36 TRINITY_DN61730_c0_g1_i1:97-864(-)
MGAAIRALAFPHPERTHSASQLQNCDNLVWVTTKTGGKTPAVYIQKTGAPLTLLYTHGNAEDLGQSLAVISRMSSICNASVFAVEYPGYSISEASGPTEALCYEAVEAAFDYLVKVLKVSPRCIVPYGRSLGSGPAVHLAAQQPELAGLVLISPLESGGRAFTNKTISLIGYGIDPFKNYMKIGQVKAMTCIVHGTDDNVVPCHNGRALYAALEKRGLAAEAMWVKGRGHNDLPQDAVFEHVQRFLASLGGEPMT